MLSPAHKLILLAALLPYLVLALYDGWLHQKARRVPVFEQILHGAIGVALGVLLFGLFTGHPSVVQPALTVFALGALWDELGYHGRLAVQERRLHHVAYACFAGFAVTAWSLGVR